MNWIKVEKWEDLPRNKHKFVVYWKDEIYFCSYDDQHYGTSFAVENEKEYVDIFLEIVEHRKWHIEQGIDVDSTMVPQPTHYALIEPPKDME